MKYILVQLNYRDADGVSLPESIGSRGSWVKIWPTVSSEQMAWGNGTIRQLAGGPASSDNHSVQADEAGVRRSAAYLLATRRHSGETNWSSATTELRPISASPRSTVIYSYLQCSRLITNPPNSLGSLLIAYNTTLSFLLDKHAPVITKFSGRRSKSNPWCTSTLRAFKSTVRRAENI